VRIKIRKWNSIFTDGFSINVQLKIIVGKNKTGDDFDKAFLDEMVVHHQGAIDMANLVLTTSKRPELLELARNIITAQTQEITMMNDWRNAWFK
jgi:uncharacterized protein (DUF305 family)